MLNDVSWHLCSAWVGILFSMANIKIKRTFKSIRMITSSLQQKQNLYCYSISLTIIFSSFLTTAEHTVNIKWKCHLLYHNSNYQINHSICFYFRCISNPKTFQKCFNFKNIIAFLPITVMLQIIQGKGLGAILVWFDPNKITLKSGNWV